MVENSNQLGLIEKIIGIIVVSVVSLMIALFLAGYVIVHFMIPYAMDHYQQNNISQH